MQTNTNGVDIALASLGCTQAELARRLGVNRCVISLWRKRGRIPLRQVKALSEVSGVPAHLLSPFFPKPVQVKASTQE